MALSCWARASLRYRIARTLLMEHLKSQRDRSRVQKKTWFEAALAGAVCNGKGSPGFYYSPKPRTHQRPSQSCAVAYRGFGHRRRLRRLRSRNRSAATSAYRTKTTLVTRRPESTGGFSISTRIIRHCCIRAIAK
jgi:hypothetical protein